MEIIKNANILDKDELLLFENHSLYKKYIYNDFEHTNVTRLILLTYFLVKYPKISNIIEQYVKKVPDEINKENANSWTALDVCLAQDKPDIKTIKVLLDNGANVNQQRINGYTSYCMASIHFNKSVMRLILEYDGINIKCSDNKYQDRHCDNKLKNIINGMGHNISLLNAKN